MSRYIDIDFILNETDEFGYENGVLYGLSGNSAPSIDIVRCGECKYWQPHEQYGYDEDNDEYHDYCRLLVPEDDYYAFRRKPDDFCSYGESRSEKPNNSKERSE